MKRLLLVAALCLFSNAFAQNLYFPPLSGAAWETVSPAALGWRIDKIDTLYNFLQSRNTKAFIVLQDGKIVLEKYFGTFARDSVWYWASAGKSVTAFLVGMAQQEGKLAISDTTSKYLGAGWTSCPPDKENKITVWHQLTMTSGLQDNVADPYCTLPSCLLYRADAGTRWAYHNAPYTLLDKVIETATGQTFNAYFAQKMKARTGMTGLWVKVDYNNLYLSNARSMARFGLLVLNKGVWQADTLMRDASYFHQMTNTSQSMNLSYGYLWWLNGKSSYMLPQTQIVFRAPWAPDAPADMIAALGKNGQILNVVPSMRLVVVRMGNAPDSALEVTTVFNNEIWQRLNAVIGTRTAVAAEAEAAPMDFALSQNYPNPFNPSTVISFQLSVNSHVTLKVFNVTGREVATLVQGNLEAGNHSVTFAPRDLAGGIYFYQLTAGKFSQTRKAISLR
ncbi:MAG: serine hydrolase [candidate division KSB1 bacterium]|nr:serine hydrolase [candidate division KSB1 bacterium]